MKYEYKLVSYRNIDDMNALGAEGWRVVPLTGLIQSMTYLLMERVIEK